MKKLLVFSGTKEGRTLALQAAKAGLDCVVCVATDYGQEVMPQHGGIQVHTGRLEADQMLALMEAGDFFAVVDATHPYAFTVSENIRSCAEKRLIPYLRLLRDIRRDGENADKEQWFSNAKECADALGSTKGNILLTTGSKELAVFCADLELKKRIYARVLPSEESIRLCREQGLERAQIIAMQGPFSQQLNTALCRQFEISILVTKSSGRAGGFEEKLNAARQAGAAAFIIGNPVSEEGLGYAQVCREIEALSGIVVPCQVQVCVSLVGIGMGEEAGLTVEARQCMADADYLVGAPRMIRHFEAKRGKAPYYKASDVMAFIQEKSRDALENMHFAVLFSGDTGFYSGSQELYRQLAGQPDYDVRVYPGICALSYLAARAGISWNDAVIRSIHGKGSVQTWQAGFLETARYAEKSFWLLSGVEDVRVIGRLLLENGLEHVRIVLGFQLSYPEEKVTQYSPRECTQIEEKGLYACYVLNDSTAKKPLTHGWPDDVFLRERVPMTKEEVREVALCKLALTKGAVVYDIGSGTGSVAVEIAALSADITVYALEKKPEAVSLILKNKEKFALRNLEVIQADAPEGLDGLLAPTHVFIGGSGGRLEDIINAVREKAPGVRIVISAVTLETSAEITRILKNMPYKDAQVVQISTNRAKMAGEYHLVQAANPVWLCTLQF